MTHSTLHSGDIRTEIRQAIEHLEHVLPGQAPIRDFVHHNTLHGYQHLKFPDALAMARELTGAHGYLPEERYREFFRQGRITIDDLLPIIAAEKGLNAGERLFESASAPIHRRDVYLAALVHPLPSLSPCELNWQIEELDALSCFQRDVAPGNRKRILAAAAAHGIEGEAAAVADLWNACLEVLGLRHFILHPEEMLDPAPQAGDIPDGLDADSGTNGDTSGSTGPMRRQSVEQLYALLDRIGTDITLRGMLLRLTGEDLLDDIRPYMARHLGSWLDLGLAAWHHKDRDGSFYTAWRNSASRNVAWVFDDLESWRHHLDSLPDDPLETVIEELKRMGLPRDRWTRYLEHLALELPGWSGMFLWRHRHPGYEGFGHRVDMTDYLAVRLVIERIFALHLCATHWSIEPSIDMLRWYFRRHPAEFLVRHALHGGHLPEYLASRAQRLTQRAADHAGEQDDGQWVHLAQLIQAWRQSPLAARPEGYSVHRSAWPLFRLSQHLGLAGNDVRGLDAGWMRTH